MRERKYNYSINKKARKKGISTHPSKDSFKQKVINKHTLAILSGLIVGSLFGFIALKLLKDNGQSAATNDAHSIELTTTSVASNYSMILSLDIPDMYIIQLGLYQDVKNAENRKKKQKTFIKKWELLISKKEVTEAEQSYLNRYVTLWKESLEGVINEEQLDKSKWEDLMKENMKSPVYKEFQKNVSQFISNKNQGEKVKLLYLLYQLEVIANN